MIRITIIWSAALGACALLALMYLLVWCRDRRSWANLCFSVTVVGVLGLAVCEMVTMSTGSPEVFGRAIRWAHLVYAIGVFGSLGFVHFYFGTGRKWLLTLAIGLRLLAVVANFTTGVNLHFGAVYSLQKITFLGEQVSMLGEWVSNPWMRLGWIASLVQIVYVLDASLRLWRTGARQSRIRAVIVGGTLAFFIFFAAAQAGLVAAGVLRMPFITSFPFLGVLLVMGYELSGDVLRAAQLGRELRESHEHLDMATNVAGIGIWVWDVMRNEIWLTDKARSLFGFAPLEKLDLERFQSRIHPDDRESVAQMRTKSIESGTDYESEYRIVLPDGEIRWIAGSGRAEFNTKGKATFMRGVSRDITHRKQADVELHARRSELAHLSRVSMLGELAGSLAHELNQPLAAMLSNSQVGRRSLDAEKPDLTEMAAILEDIVTDAKRAGGIIHGMRSLLKKDASVEIKSLQVNDVVNQTLALLHSENIVRKANVALYLDESLPPARANRAGFQQVLINLVINGLDAMKILPNRGPLKIATSQQDDSVIVSVHDSGPGIPPEIMARLFDPLFSTKPDGLGLGLSISRTIMEHFGGELLAGNHPDGGAIFRMKLRKAVS